MGKKARDELKMLESMKASLEAEINSLRLNEENLKKELATKRSNLNAIRKKIRYLSEQNKDLIVSEHAIIRYLERVLGVDMKIVASKILPAEELELIDKLGNGKYPINDGEFRIVVRDRVVVTVTAADGDKH